MPAPLFYLQGTEACCHLIGREHDVRVTPGGGVEDGESYAVAAQRELQEETGFTLAPGPCVLERERRLHQHGEEWLFHERYFLVRTDVPAILLDGLSLAERLRYRGHRWWSCAELEVLPISQTRVSEREW
jgi:8-oxo-dGTP pyrophosphatase MutT (NUDIX family)